jgi:hypothetical protein
MTRSIRREDPAYLAAMREAKELFDAEMAKSAMRSRGRSAARPAVTTQEGAHHDLDAEMPEDIAAVIASSEEPKAPAKTATKASTGAKEKDAVKAPVRRRTRRAATAAQ